jgi:hypothetical protein
MDFAVPAGDPSAPVDQDRAVEMPAFRGEFGVAEVKGHAEFGRGFEQRARNRARHLGLEVRVDLGLRLQVPAGEEGGQRQLRKDDQLRTAPLGLAQQRQEACDHAVPALAAGDGPELRCGDGKWTRHVSSYPVSHVPQWATRRSIYQNWSRASRRKLQATYS